MIFGTPYLTALGLVIFFVIFAFIIVKLEKWVEQDQRRYDFKTKHLVKKSQDNANSK